MGGARWGESPKHNKSSAVHLRSPAGRGGDEGLGDGQIINQDTIWHHGALETPTTVSTAAVLPRGPPCAARGMATAPTTRLRAFIFIREEEEGGHIQSKSIFAVTHTKVAILHKIPPYFLILEHQALFMGSRKKSWIEKWILYLPYCCSRLRLSKEE